MAVSEMTYLSGGDSVKMFTEQKTLGTSETWKVDCGFKPRIIAAHIATSTGYTSAGGEIFYSNDADYGLGASNVYNSGTIQTVGASSCIITEITDTSFTLKNWGSGNRYFTVFASE